MRGLDLEISVATDNNRDAVAACLRSIPGAARRISYAVHVIDNASTDGSAQMLAQEFPDINVHTNAVRQGFAANHNQILRPAVASRTAPYVLVLNDDTELHAGALDALVEAMDERATLGAMAPLVVDGQGREAAMRLAHPTVASSLRYDWCGVGERPDPTNGWLQGCCLLLRTEAVARVGAFDEQFFLFYEDADLGRRLQAGGWDLAVCPAARITHLGHQTVLRAEMARFTPMQGLRSRFLYFAKHRGRGRSLALSWAGRGLLALRGARLVGRGALGRTEERQRGWAMVRLARYDPRRAPSLPARSQAKPAAARRPDPMQAGMPDPS